MGQRRARRPRVFLAGHPRRYLSLAGIVVALLLAFMAAPALAQDASRPVLSGTPTIVPNVVNVSADGQTVRVEAHLVDNVGVTLAIFSLRDSTDEDRGAGFPTLVSGTTADGVWRSDIYIPRNVNGTLKLHVFAADALFNTLEVTTEVTLIVTGGDSDAPVVEGTPTVAPATVNLESGPVDVTVTVTVRDDASGVLAVEGVFRAPDSTAIAGRALLRVAGDSHLGSWQGPVTIPQNTPPGRYRLEFDLTDLAGNSADRLTAVTLQVAGGDTIPPALIGAVTVEPSSVSLSSGDATVIVTATVGDSSGVEYVWVDLRDAEDASVATGSGDRVGGTVNNGAWRTEVRVPVDTPLGSYRVVIGAGDLPGNFVELATGRTVTVTANDSQAPTLAGAVTLEPDSVSVAGNPASVTVRATLQDDRSGVSEVEARFRESGGGIMAQASLERVEGDSLSGVWQGTVTIPANTATGSYPLQLMAQDAAGNSAVLSAARSLKVGGGDSTPPALTGTPTLDPASVDVSGGAQTVEVHFGLADAGSGVARARPELRPIGPGQSLEATAERTSGDAHAGDYRAVFTVPATTPEIVLEFWIVAEDVAGNDVNLKTNLLLQVRRFTEGRVTFQVDLRPLARPGIFAADFNTPVYVDLFDLAPPVVLTMTDANGDTIYEAQQFVPVGHDYHYAFAFSPGFSDTTNWLYEKGGRAGGRLLRLDSGSPVILPVVSFDDRPLPVVPLPFAAMFGRGVPRGGIESALFDGPNQFTDMTLRELTAARPAAVGVRRYAGSAGGSPPAGIAVLSTAAWWGIASYAPGAVLSAAPQISWELTGGVTQPGALRWLHRAGPGAPWEVVPITLDADARTVRGAVGAIDGDWTLGSTTAANTLTPTLPDTVSDPNPADGSFVDDTLERLAWRPANGAVDYDIWLWPAGTPRPATPTQAHLVRPEFHLFAPLAPLSQWSWQVAARNRIGVTAGPVWSLTVDTAPDLVVEEINAPADVYAGQEVEVRWVVRNRGNQATNAAEWLDAIFYSADQDLNFRFDALVGTARNGAWLGPGEAYAGRADVTIPAGEVGNSYLIVFTDLRRQVGETNDNNNLSLFPIHVRPALKADLRVDSFTVPNRAFAGQSAHLQWRVSNAGERPAAAPWLDEVYLSADSTFESNRDLPLGYAWRLEPLGVDSSYVVRFAVTLPDTTVGPRWLIVVADGLNQLTELDEAVNNRKALPITITLTPPPDLVPVGLTVDPGAGALSGRPITIRWRVQNQGPGGVPPRSWSDRLWLVPGVGASTDSTFLLGSRSRSRRLEPDSTYADLATVRLPDGISGQWLVRLGADWDNRVFEYQWEGNNGAEVPLAVSLAPPPDLRPRFGSIPPRLTAGDQRTFAWSVENVGADTARAVWTDRLYICPSATWDSTQARLLTGSVRTGNLAVGAGYSVEPLISIPPGLPAGDWYLFLRADDDHRVYEHEGEANNVVRSGPIPVSAYPADLQPRAVSGPGSAESGAPVTIAWTVKNQGDGRVLVSDWTDRIWLSTDAILDPAVDLKVADIDHRGGLNGGDDYRRSVEVRIPQGISGQFRLLVQADTRDAAIESDEGNNVGAGPEPITVTLAPPADLVIETLDAPNVLAAGQPFVLYRRVRNSGVGPTPAAAWFDGLYLSKNALRDREDIALRAPYHVGGLAAGAAYAESASVSLPGWVSGSYYLLAQADSRNDVYEHEAEQNNLAVRLVSVDLPPPTDLVVRSVTIDSVATPGDSVTVAWVLENRGTYPAVGYLTDGVYMSADTLWTIDDPLVGLIDRRINLPGGATMAITTRVSLADPQAADAEAITRKPLPGLAPGLYHAVVRANIRNTIRETDVTNNAGRSARKARLGMPLLPLDVLTPSTLAPGQARYWRLDVSEADRTLVLDLGGQTGTVNELYVRYGEVPTRSQFDLRGDGAFTANQRVTVPSTAPGSYYIMGYGASESGGTQPITLLAHLHQFEITGVEPSEAGHGGPVTLKITGSGIAEDVDLALVKGAARRTPTKRWLLDPTTIYATFDLSGAEAGDYDLVAHQVDRRLVNSADPDTVYRIVGEEGNATRSGALRVVAPNRAVMDIRRSGARRVRVTQEFEVVVEATNLSNRDMRAPLLLVYGLPDYLKGVDPGTAQSRGVRLFLMAAPDGPAGLYRPGVTGRLDIAGTAPGHPTTLLIDVEPVERSRYAFDFDRELRNAGVDPQRPQWSEAVQALRARGLDSWEDYAELLAETATRQGLQGEAPREAEELLMLALQEAHRRILYPDYDAPIVPPATPQDVAAQARHGGPAAPGLERPEPGIRPLDITPDCSVGTVVKQLAAMEVVTRIMATALCAPGGAYHLNHYLHGDGSNISYGPGGYVDALVRAHTSARVSFEQVHREVSQQLREQLEAFMGGQCSGQSGFPTFNFNVRKLAFYVGGGAGVKVCRIPATELQVMFGGMQSASAMVKSLDLQVNPFYDCQQGCVLSYTGVIRYRWGDKYEFDPNDVKEGLFDQYARNLQLCGVTHPFSTEIVMEEPVEGRIVIVEKDDCDDEDEPEDPWPVDVVASLDPNDLIGPAGVGDGHWINRNAVLPYTVRFENDPAKATAPAQTVTVSQVLDPDFDVRTFRLGSFGFGAFRFEPPANSSFYSNRLDVRDSLGVFVDVTAGIDLVRGEAFWSFRSIDPTGGDLPADPLAGFLPPDDARGRGQGFVSYSGRARSTTRTGDVIQAKARIVFDQNEPIDTPAIFNAIDADPPRTRVEALPATLDTTAINLSWAGGDSTGSGVENWALYRAIDDGEFSLLQDGITRRGFTATGEYGHRYRFYVQAVDRVGNREPAKSAAEATVRLVPGGGGPPARFAARPNTPNPFKAKTVISFDMPQPGQVELRVYDSTGRVIFRRLRGSLPAGSWEQEVDMTGHPSGIYYGELVVRYANGSEDRKVRKLVLVH